VASQVPSLDRRGTRPAVQEPTPQARPTSQTRRRTSRRLAPRLYKLLLTAHIIVAVGWLGIVTAKLVVGIGAVTSDATAATTARAMAALDIAFPFLVIGTAVTGVALSLGTRRGLLRHYWVTTKIVLGVTVIATTFAIGDGLARQALATPGSGPAGEEAATPLASLSEPVNLLIALSVTHALMLTAATVLSVYKPWGTTWFARRGKHHPTAAPTMVGVRH
jgi:hypothetical protein